MILEKIDEIGSEKMISTWRSSRFNNGVLE